MQEKTLFNEPGKIKSLPEYQLERIKGYFEAIFKYEKDYEKLKKSLIKIVDFEIEKIYSAIDYMDKGYVSANMLKGFMKRQGLGLSDEELIAFYARFGIFGDSLKFKPKDFEVMVKPFDISM